MNNPTEMMRSILQSEKAQEIIDYVSPIYGKSYVGLWIFEAIGTVLDNVWQISDQLRYETNPATANLLLSYWEAQYAIPPDPTLTIEQRRQRIIAKIESRASCNPRVLASAVSAALNGAHVEVYENVAKNTFRVNIRDAVSDITPAVNVIEEMKPAHLIYTISVALQNAADIDIKVATAITHGLKFEMEVSGEFEELGVYQVTDKLYVLFGVQASQSGSVLTIE